MSTGYGLARRARCRGLLNLLYKWIWSWLSRIVNIHTRRHTHIHRYMHRYMHAYMHTNMIYILHPYIYNIRISSYWVCFGETLMLCRNMTSTPRISLDSCLHMCIQIWYIYYIHAYIIYVSVPAGYVLARLWCDVGTWFQPLEFLKSQLATQVPI